MNCFPDDVLARFSARQIGRKRNWIAHCPLHVDRHPSLAFWIGRDGRLMLGCWSCKARSGGSHGYKKDVLAWAGLTMGDLFADRRENGGSPDARPHVQPKVVAVYPYTDEGGLVLYEKVRLEPGRRPGEKKSFFQRRPDGAGGHLTGLGGVRRVPYRLPDLVDHPDWPVLYVGGEKDVETFYAMGMRGALATCTTEGEGSGWGLDSPYPEFFCGRRVVLIPDEDDAGLVHVRQVAGALVMGGVGSLRLCRLPGLTYSTHGGPDLTDFVALHGGPGSPRAIVALAEAVRAAREWR